MTEAPNWVDTSEFHEDGPWSTVSNIEDREEFSTPTEETSEKWKASGVIMETNSDRFLLSISLLLSCISFAIAILKYFANIESSSVLFANWFTLGILFGILSICQLEGIGLFLARIMKKSSYLIFVCLIASIFGTCLGGYLNSSRLCVFSSIFQCICLVFIISLYYPSILLFNHVSTSKAKE